MKKVLFALLLCLALSGCGEKTIDESKSQIEEKKQSKEELIDENSIIVDVRTPEEYAEGHVVGSINIPVDTIDKNVSLDKSKAIFVYCKSGVRSEKAYKMLKSLGYIVQDLGAYSKINLPKE